MLDIIIPVKDNLHWLKMCLISLRAHTKNPYRITIIENGCNASTLNYIHSEALLNDMQILHHDNSSFSSSCNLGISATTQPYVCLLNSDVIVQDGWDVAMVADLQDPRIGLTGARSNAAAGIQGSVDRRLASPPTKDKSMTLAWQAEPDGAKLGTRINGQPEPLCAPYLIFLCVMGTRKVFNEVGPLDSKFGWGGCEDLDYSWLVEKKGYKNVISLAYVLHGCSQTFAKEMTVEAKSAADVRAWSHLESKHGKPWIKQHTKARPKVGLGIISRTDNTLKAFSESLIMGIYALSLNGFDLQPIWLTRTFVNLAREKVVNYALEIDCDYLVFIDDDQIFTAENLLRLVQAQKDICGSLIYQRIPPYRSCVFNWSVIKPDGTPDESKFVTNVEGIEHTGIREVTAVGFGMTCLSRKVMEAVKSPRFEWHADGFGEDITFCIKASRLGIKSYVNTDVIVGHVTEPLIVDEKTRPGLLDRYLKGIV